MQSRRQRWVGFFTARGSFARSRSIAAVAVAVDMQCGKYLRLHLFVCSNIMVRYVASILTCWNTLLTLRCLVIIIIVSSTCRLGSRCHDPLITRFREEEEKEEKRDREHTWYTVPYKP